MLRTSVLARGRSKVAVLRVCSACTLRNMAQPRAMENVAAHAAQMMSPSAERNKQPILDVLVDTLRQHDMSSPRILEVASGTGQHVAHFAAALSDATFQPTEHAEEALPSIQAWTQGLSNVEPAKHLDAAGEWAGFEAGRYDVVMVANMCHISPWACTTGLCRGSGQVLRPGGLMLVYGPFKRDGQCTTESNASFDRSLRSQNPEWGYRDLQEVEEAAQQHGLALQSVKEMPANNFFLTFKKGSS